MVTCVSNENTKPGSQLRWLIVLVTVLWLTPMVGCVFTVGDPPPPEAVADSSTSAQVSSGPSAADEGHETGAATSGEAGTDTDATAEGGDEDPLLCFMTPTYDEFGKAFFGARCQGCHSVGVPVGEREGAPLDVNFDELSQVRTHAHNISYHVLDAYDMPPGKLLDSCEYDLLESLIESLDVGPCQPVCAGRECGNDRCGGSCGRCEVGLSCLPGTGQCIEGPCTGDCTGLACGPDGCGGSCGECGSGLNCTESQTCQCVPQCGDRVCGDDGCGGVCGTCENAQDVCTEAGSCECVPACEGKVCGTDGCGGSCGTCSWNEACDATGESCECQPQCEGRACGPNGCGGSCGDCPMLLVCNERKGQCYSDCNADCRGRECGSDDCGGSCGSCSDAQICTEQGNCVCAPDCVGRACGPDGCGGQCGECTAPASCNDSGQCVCIPECDGLECGNDGCGGSCGTCPTDQVCDAGACVTPCTPQCTGLECGADGCGGSCGSCARGQDCGAGQCAWKDSTFGDIYPGLVTNGCADTRCHNADKKAAQLDLSSQSIAYEQLVGRVSSQCGDRLLVAANDPDSSYLVHKVEGIQICSGSKMPKRGEGLTLAQQNDLRAWIATGARP